MRPLTNEKGFYRKETPSPSTKCPYSSNSAFDELLRKMGEIHDMKRRDYSGQGNPLGNFKRCEAFGVPAFLGIMVRMSDKWARVENLARPASGLAVKDESIEDTLLDLANYALLAILARKEHFIDHKGG